MSSPENKMKQSMVNAKRATRFVLNNPQFAVMTEEEYRKVQTMALKEALAIREDYAERGWIVYAAQDSGLHALLLRIQQRTEERNAP